MMDGLVVSKNVRLSAKARAIKGETANALEEMAKQSPALADAINNSGKQFSNCLEECVKNAGGSLSDFTVFRRAVKFYLPKYDLHFRMELIAPDSAVTDNTQTVAEQAPAPKPEGKTDSILLDDLLDF